MNKYLGIALIVFALAIAAIPVFTDCQSQGKSLTTDTGKTIPMKCHWTGIAEIGTGVPLVAIGSMMIVSRRKKESLLNLGILGCILGIFTILLPTKLIGVCQSTMLCNTAMRPSLIVLGSLVIVGSVISIALSQKASD